MDEGIQPHYAVRAVVCELLHSDEGEQKSWFSLSQVDLLKGLYEV